MNKFANLKKLFFKRSTLIILILILATLPRLFLLGEVPFYLNRDEASIGYNAYALMRTGRDEHGVAWPINVESFGDWKLPIYIYVTIPFIAIFGLTTWSIKLPAVIAGLTVVGMTYLLLTQLLKNYGSEKDQKNYFWLPVLASLVVALSPWAIHLSRLTYEANLAMALFLTGWWLIERSKKTTLASKFSATKLQFFGGLILLMMTVFTYHSYQVFLPIFALVWAGFNFTYIKQIIAKQKLFVCIVATILLVAIGLFWIGQQTDQASEVKFTGLSIFEDAHYLEDLHRNRQYLAQAGVPSWMQSLIINTYTLRINAFFTNIVQTFSPLFLFVDGGAHRTHNFSIIANFHLLELFVVIGGMIIFLRRHLGRLPAWWWIIVSWLLVAALPAAITVEPAHSVRFAAALPAIASLIALGLLSIGKIWSRFTIPILVALYLFSVWQWSFNYFIVAPNRDYHHSEWLMPRLADALYPLLDEYEEIYVPLLRRSPYIFFLFHWQYDPNLLHYNLSHSPPDEEGFTYAYRLGNINFEDLPATFENEQRRVLILFPYSAWSDWHRADERFTIIETFADERDPSHYYLVDFRPSLTSSNAIQP
ncbi:MAG: hypothetical protein LBG64_03200 [Pseudomonadales bacterium]|jgi:hypothetical protein|nr:hypothetical protein [Pseudomonadales bacterium]